MGTERIAAGTERWTDMTDVCGGGSLLFPYAVETTDVEEVRGSHSVNACIVPTNAAWLIR